MYLVTADEMRRMDGETIHSLGVPGRVLMECAGWGATRFFLECFPGAETAHVGVMAGRGNNGGDGFVMARRLHERGIRVTVYLLSERARVGGDAEANLKLLDALDIPVVEAPDAAAFQSHRVAMAHHGIWIDAIFGTGLNAEARGFFREAIEFLNETGRPVFAVDIPSGLNSDTGQPMGACVRAAATATFGWPKIGHLTQPGADYTGRLEVVDIGIPGRISAAIAPRQFLLDEKWIKGSLKARPSSAHKGATGHVLVVAGAPGKSGAAAMTAISAARAGAGLVTLAIPGSINSVMETLALEVMTHPLPESGAGILDETAFQQIADLTNGKTCMALGPGLGAAARTGALVRRVIATCKLPLVIDADGLNLLTGHTDLLKNRSASTILTPHPGEMGRLCGLSVAEIQKDRIGVARAHAVKWSSWLALKGARTVIAGPDGRVWVNPTGNPGMASGGMGDVLTGMIAGFLAQGYEPGDAARLAVYLHGAAADTLARSMGPIGYLAGDVMAAIPAEIGRHLDFSSATNPFRATHI